MRIAFFSYEFPIETAGGGIGTYLEIAANLLIHAGHDVVVFAGTKKETGFWEGETVFRVPATSWSDFNRILPEYFLPIHNNKPFDVAECTDFNGCGLYVKKARPELPVVVKLHTPLYLIDNLQYRPLNFWEKCRFRIGGLRRLKWSRIPEGPSLDNYRDEFEMIALADKVCSPSRSIQRQLSEMGFDLDDKSDIVPLPFIADAKIKQITARENLGSNPHIVFIGRLEMRKGVIDLLNAIPSVLKMYPNALFTFVGGAAASPQRGLDMIAYLRRISAAFAQNVRFVGRVPHKQILSYLDQGDLFVYPSHYESFGIVCCEAMAAGKAVIGSRNGGMAEMIEHDQSGVLIEPGCSSKIAAAILGILANDSKRIQLGIAARKRIANLLHPDLIVSKQVASYQHAIAVCENRNLESKLVKLSIKC